LASVFFTAVVPDRGTTWTVENLEADLPQRALWAEEKWQQAMVIGQIPQV
jgi:hypothetical protein